MAANPRQDLYLEISRNLVANELTDLCNYISGANILPAGFVQKANAHQIFTQLEKEQKVNPGDLVLLADLLRRIGRHDYADKAEKIAETERKGRRSKIVQAKRSREEVLDTSQASSSQQKRKERDGDHFPAKKQSHCKTGVFKKSVKEYYEFKLSTFRPLNWNNDFTLPLRDIFTVIELIQTFQKQPSMPKGNVWSTAVKAKERKILDSLGDLFNPLTTGQLASPRCILVEGEPGVGKTTFLSKEALDAVSGQTKLGRWHDIILLIRLREVREGDTIEEIVWDQCVPETTEGIDVQSIKAILLRNESKVLFLLDGYDELRPKARADKQAIPKLLSGKLYLKSTVVITSRPSAGVQEHTRPDCHVHILGFSSEYVEKYAEKYFSITGNPEQAGKLITLLTKSRVVTDLTHTPIFLLLVCLLWEEKPEMVSPGTMTELYENLLTCLVRKYCKREGVAMPGNRLPSELLDSLLQLGKLALEALLIRNETLLDLAELETKHVNCELILKLGFMSLEVSSSKLHPRKQLNFSHKTMQEFLAGRYVAHALKNQEKDIDELLQLTSITKVLKHSILLQFTCGCDSHVAQAVMEELSKLCSQEYSHLQPDDFKKSHIPVKPVLKKSVESYRKFGLVCLDILNEMKGRDILQAFSKALPIIIIDKVSKSKWHAVLKYYLENIQFSRLPDRLICDCDNTEGLQYLEQTFTSLIPGLQLDLNLSHMPLDSPDKISRLVSVMRNVPALRTLDASSIELTVSSITSLVQGFRHVSLIKELDFTGNYRLGDDGMEVLQVGLSSVPHLAVLRLRAVGMTAVGMSSLAPYMRHLVGLRELDISYNEIGDRGLESFTAILSTFNAMQVLVLWHIGISTRGMRKLVPALRQLNGLIKLDIGDNAIEDRGLECLADILNFLTALKVLILSQTGISHKGISALVKALPHLLELQVLDVLNNEMQDSGIVPLVQTFCQPSSLDIEQNPPGDKSQPTASPYNTTLQELYIGWNSGVTGTGLGRVAQLVSALPALTWLDMSGQWDTPAHLPEAAAMALAEALPRIPALEFLDLENILMEPAGFQAVVQAAEKHPTLERLGYSKALVPEGAETTAHCLTLTVRQH